MPTNVAKSKVCEHCAQTYPPMSNRQRFCCTKCAIWGQVRFSETGCWVWLGTRVKKTGYGSFHIKSAPMPAHRVSYVAFNGDIADGLEICHRCDNRLCVNPDHLFVGTHAENMTDCAKKQRNARKLTDQQVLEIRSAVGVSKAELGRRYGVTDVMIGKIVRGEWWKYLLPDSKENVASEA